MKSKTCILYSGVDYDPKDTSGNGVCLDVFLPDGTWKKCKDVIAEGNCPKKKTTPYEVS